ncbi:thiamine-phosphate kinase [Maricaulis sp.]|uniref:thiamine-phosphate kinase n=1 Tax=Maricaulis sp. TaxID=1486257 RepID=UPI001B0744BC|nr:thiamine-phosphate kinase [Maricaulis sp.]MBO6766512.1 thiamine-phosphate kinase [Maricaulis sp.]
MASGGEFDFIRTRLGPLTRNHAAALGLRDDAAVLDVPAGQQLVLACDTLIAGVHFRTDDGAAVAAARAMRSNVSDLAAMGAQPLGYLSALSWPRGIDPLWRDEFVAALAEEQDRFGLVLLGGDTTSTPGPMTVTLTLLGCVTEGTSLLRSGAIAGDDVWVTGTIGDAVLGLASLEGEAGAPAELVSRYTHPMPRLTAGLALRGIATSAIDISDGLLADAAHIAETSGLGLEIVADRVPLSAPALAWLDAGGEGGLGRLLSGGDDYELLFTAPASRRAQVEALSLDAPVTRIGRAVAGEGVTCLGPDGEPVTIDRAGFTHF